MRTKLYKKEIAFTSIKNAAHIDMPQTKMKFAFTLAEVLITLGIIGVVAAITIPGLINERQKKITVTKLQRAISVLNQAYKLSYDEVGEPSVEESFTMGADEYFKTYWMPYIKTAHICKTYQDCGYNSNFPWVLSNGDRLNIALIGQNKRTTFYTADGFLYIIFTASGSEGHVVANKTVYVDINAGAKPNKVGKDLFVLTRVEDDGGGIQPAGYKSTKSVINRNCSKSNQGTYCAEKIRQDGWKIEKDYPWQ